MNRSRFRRYLRRSALAVAVLAVLWSLVTVSQWLRVSAQVSAWEAAGLPTSLSQLTLPPRPPAGQDATQHYEQAFIHMTRSDPAHVYRRGLWCQVPMKYSEVQADLLQEGLQLSANSVAVLASAEGQEVLDLLRRASALSGVHWYRDLSQGPGLILAELQPLMAGQALLLMAARQAEAADRASEAAELRLAALRVAGHYLEASSTLLEITIGLRLEARALDEMSAAAERGHVTPLPGLEKVWVTDLVELLRRASITERLALGEWIFGRIGTSETAGLLGNGHAAVPSLYASTVSLPLRLHDQAVYSGYWWGMHQALVQRPVDWDAIQAAMLPPKPLIPASMSDLLLWHNLKVVDQFRVATERRSALLALAAVD